MTRVGGGVRRKVQAAGRRGDGAGNLPANRPCVVDGPGWSVPLRGAEGGPEGKDGEVMTLPAPDAGTYWCVRQGFRKPGRWRASDEKNGRFPLVRRKLLRPQVAWTGGWFVRPERHGRRSLRTHPAVTRVNGASRRSVDRANTGWGGCRNRTGRSIRNRTRGGPYGIRPSEGRAAVTVTTGGHGTARGGRLGSVPARPAVRTWPGVRTVASPGAPGLLSGPSSPTCPAGSHRQTNAELPAVAFRRTRAPCHGRRANTGSLPSGRPADAGSCPRPSGERRLRPAVRRTRAPRPPG